MIRRAALAATVLLLLTSASASAASHTVQIVNKTFQPNLLTVNVGDAVAWQNTSAKKHNVTSNVPFLWTAPTIKPGKTSAPIAFNQAGTFLYHCTIHARMKGRVAVAMTVTPTSGTTSTQYLVTVATATTPGPFTHEIQVRINGGPWQPRGGTSGQTFTFVAISPGTWDIQTRLHHLLNGSITDWSPSVTVTVS